MFCPNCGNSNDNTAKFCSGCGSALPKSVKEESPTQAEINVPNNPDEFYKAIVDPKNQDYYLSQFSRFDSNGKVSASWHWPAFFVTFYWLLYRKMWLNAIIYFFLPYFVMIPLGVTGAVAGDSAGIVIGIGYILFLIATFLLPPMYADALYYKHCKKRIAEASVSSQNLERRLGELSGKGGTSSVALIFVLIFAFIAFIGILAAIAIPAYQDYTTRARMVGAVALGSNAADSVASYYYQHQEVPSSLEQAGFATPISPAVKGLSVNSENGTVIVTMSSPPIIGKTLLFVPTLDSNKKIVWTCMSQEIQDKYLPQQCRQKK
ncbi:fimbrial protein precursor [mine drainage metagenome]|uniref:Fimbrial protein n=1 Tax=mine drainage metagenome TaxID=410659 RepID=A0A1J5TVP4_9ZZZZ